MSAPAPASSRRRSFLRAAAVISLGGLALNGCERSAESDAARHKPQAAVSATAKNPAAKRAGLRYLTQLEDIAARQQALAETTDEEAAGHRLNERKKLFATDAVLDPALATRDLAYLHARFNALASEDGLRFRFAASDLGARRDCLEIHPERKNRYARAQAVETCMIRLSAKRLANARPAN